MWCFQPVRMLQTNGDATCGGQTPPSPSSQPDALVASASSPKSQTDQSQAPKSEEKPVVDTRAESGQAFPRTSKQFGQIPSVVAREKVSNDSRSATVSQGARASRVTSSTTTNHPDVFASQQCPRTTDRCHFWRSLMRQICWFNDGLLRRPLQTSVRFPDSAPCVQG